MRRPSYALSTALWAVLSLASCVSAPTDEEWLAVGFRTPEQTFGTFKTALKSDQEDLEYRCLSNAFKRREGVSQVAYREFREKLFSEKPWLKLAATAEVLEVEALGADACRLLALVDTVFVDQYFEVTLRRETAYEVFDEEGLLEGDQDHWQELVMEARGNLQVVVPFPEGVALDELVEVRAHRSWKIDSFATIEAPDS